MNNIIDLAVAYWRLEKWVANATVEKKMAANSSLRTMKRFLDANGIEIRDLTGQAFDYGMNLKVIHSDMPENDPTAKPIISEMIKPMVLQNGSVISMPFKNESKAILEADKNASMYESIHGIS